MMTHLSVSFGNDMQLDSRIPENVPCFATKPIFSVPCSNVVAHVELLTARQVLSSSTFGKRHISSEKNTIRRGTGTSERTPSLSNMDTADYIRSRVHQTIRSIVFL